VATMTKSECRERSVWIRCGKVTPKTAKFGVEARGYGETLKEAFENVIRELRVRMKEARPI